MFSPSDGFFLGKYKPFGEKISFLACKKKTYTVRFYEYVFTLKIKKYIFINMRLIIKVIW